jgi:inositol-phosphate phosphatase / L-galactose 1-phosphate phosphatase / histidinol-phosphatase
VRDTLFTMHEPDGGGGARPMRRREDDEIKQALPFALSLLDRTRGDALRRWRRTRGFEFKGDGSPVTVADRAIEATMRRALGARFPAHGVAGEEHAAERPDASWQWLLDPIDGTKSFVCALPLWGTLIALLHDGRPRLGLIEAPVLAQRWIGVAGRPTLHASHHGTKRCRVSRCTSLASARLCLPAPDAFASAEADAARALAGRAALRRYGGDCCSYGALAAGGLDVIVETGLDDHDFLPMVPIIEGAGGVMTDWSGQELSLQSDGRVVAAATRTLHAQALAMLRAALS